MSSRARQRPSHNQDLDEERRLWRGIREKAREVDAMVARSNSLGRQILEAEQQQASGTASDGEAAALDEKLEKLYRENLKLCEDVNSVLAGDGSETNLLDSIEVLAAIREASEESAAANLISSQPLERRAAAAAASDRSASAGGGGGKVKKGRGVSASANAVSTPTKGSAAPSVAGDSEVNGSGGAVLGGGGGGSGGGGGGGGEESAAASPRLRLGVPGKDKSSRSGSVVTTREPSVKIEDGAESVASSTDTKDVASSLRSDSVPQSGTAGAGSGGGGGGVGGKSSSRITFKAGEIVFYRHKQASSASSAQQQEGEGILATITSVIGEGKQRRYEVQDVDPQDSTGPIRASVSQLISIPSSNSARGLQDLPKGRGVLAQYPDTTTFYRAVVSTTWKLSEANRQEKWELVRLRFDGEENENIESEVERRLVLLEK